MTISEPATMATDYLLAVAGGFFAARLWRASRRHRSAAAGWWSAAFVTMALGAAAGGTHHGFAEPLGEAGRWLTWRLTLYLLAATSFLLVAATAFAVLAKRLRTLVVGLALLKLVAFALFLSRHGEFRYVVYDYGSAMAVVLLLQVWVGLRSGKPGAGLLIAGVLVGFVAAVIQQSGFDLHRHFNHNDLYHLVQLLALWLFYRGALRQTAPHPNP